MGFGTGVLFSAVAFELTSEAYDRAGAPSLVAGLAAGALTFFAGDWAIDRRGGHRRKSPNGPAANATGAALVLGALLDGIPESAAIGITVVEGGSVGVAVLLGGLPLQHPRVPVGLGRHEGERPRPRRTSWGCGARSTAASTVAAAVGYAALGSADDSVVAVTQAFAAGAILTMLADTMMPEAVEHAGRLVGLVTVLGFACAFLLSMA